MKHLKLFNLKSEYDSYKESSDFVTPNISFVEETGSVSYKPFIDYSKEYLTIEALEDSTFKLTSNNCEYSLDNGQTWILLEAKTDTPIIPAGNKIRFKATNPNISTEYTTYGIGTFNSTGKFNVSGNIMSLLYGDDFVGQIDLSGKNYVFSHLFRENSNIIDASNLILPAITLSEKCYRCMFYKCASLTTPPQLPATTLASSCYYCMFDQCTSLVKTSELPAITLAPECYSYMFNGCTSLTKAPELPATTLAKKCYYCMFSLCASLITSPLILPATTLADSCYAGMFDRCPLLMTAPELPAPTLVATCYQTMFANCSNLNNIVMLATDISARNCLSNWVKGVATSGTFTKHPDMNDLPINTSGIPKGWTVKDYQE